MREQQRQKDKAILGPLVNADLLEEGAYVWLAVNKFTGDSSFVLLQRPEQARMRVGHHGAAGAGQQSAVGHGVADVAISSGEAIAECGEFVFAGEVSAAVRGQDAIEEAKICSHAFCQAAVCGCGKINLPSGSVLLLQKLQQGAVIGQIGRVKRDHGGDLRLEGRLSAKNPAGNTEQGKGTVAYQDQYGIHQRVGLNQRAVHVYAEWRHIRSSQWLRGRGRNIGDGGWGVYIRQERPFLPQSVRNRAVSNHGLYWK